jgi:hypothetical protein
VWSCLYSNDDNRIRLRLPGRALTVVGQKKPAYAPEKVIIEGVDNTPDHATFKPTALKGLSESVTEIFTYLASGVIKG